MHCNRIQMNINQKLYTPARETKDIEEFYFPRQQKTGEQHPRVTGFSSRYQGGFRWLGFQMAGGLRWQGGLRQQGDKITGGLRQQEG